MKHKNQYCEPALMLYIALLCKLTYTRMCKYVPSVQPTNLDCSFEEGATGTRTFLCVTFPKPRQQTARQ